MIYQEFLLVCPQNCRVQLRHKMKLKLAVGQNLSILIRFHKDIHIHPTLKSALNWESSERSVVRNSSRALKPACV